MLHRYFLAKCRRGRGISSTFHLKNEDSRGSTSIVLSSKGVLRRMFYKKAPTDFQNTRGDFCRYLQ